MPPTLQTSASQKNAFVAGVVRDALTTPPVDLLRGSKSTIEKTIADAIAKAEDRWPEVAEGQGIDLAAQPHRSAAAALDSLARYSCENRHSTTGAAIRDALAALLLGGDRVAALRSLQFLSDRQAADFVDVVDGLLVHRHGRIYDQQVEQAFARHGGAAFYAESPSAARTKV